MTTRLILADGVTDEPDVDQAKARAAALSILCGVRIASYRGVESAEAARHVAESLASDELRLYGRVDTAMLYAAAAGLLKSVEDRAWRYRGVKRALLRIPVIVDEGCTCRDEEACDICAPLVVAS